MDPSLRLQGRFNSGLHRMQKSVFCPRDPEDAAGDDGQHHYFMVDPDSGGGRKAAAGAGAFLKQAALWNWNRNRNFLTSGTGTVTCSKVGNGTVINYGFGTGARYKIMYLISFI
jgi:hypothetical protein